MDFKELIDIDISNLSTMDTKSRQETIMIGKRVYIQSVKDVSGEFDIDFMDLLTSSIRVSEKEIERLAEQEHYEVCYFLTNIVKEIKKEYYGL